MVQVLGSSISEMVHKLMASTPAGAATPVLVRDNVICGEANPHVYSVSRNILSPSLSLSLYIYICLFIDRKSVV